MKNRQRRPAAAKHSEAKRGTPATSRLAQPVQVVQIEKPVYGGSFLARVDGKAVFVPLVLPGETAGVRITEEKRGYSTAEVEAIVAPALERIAPACRHFGACGGCQYQHTNYSAQLTMKQAILRETFERGGVNAPERIDVLASDEAGAWSYRNRIRLALDARGNPGYRSRRSNAVVPIAECPIASPLLVHAALQFAGIARNVAPKLRVEEISLFCDGAETSLLVGVFARSIPTDALDSLATAMAERIPELRGMEFAHADDGQGDDRMRPIIARWGEPHLMYRAAGFDYRVDNGAFFQVNRRLVDALVDLVAAPASGKLAWDLFAGVGLFARKLTERFDRVIAVESSPLAMPGLKANLHGTSGSAVQASTLNFLRGMNRTEQPDLIVVDPPRAGLGAEITGALSKIGAPELIYVSCDPATLARDLRALVSTGYSIKRITLADLFPQTFHLETVVQMRRS